MAKTKLTPELQERIIRALRAGVPIRWAAEAGGIHYTTFYDWQARGNEWLDGEAADEECPETERPFRDFAYATRRAGAEAKARYAATLYEIAFNESFREEVRLRAIQFFLTHGDREHWHPVQHAQPEESDEITVELAWPD